MSVTRIRIKMYKNIACWLWRHAPRADHQYLPPGVKICASTSSIITVLSLIKSCRIESLHFTNSLSRNISVFVCIRWYCSEIMLSYHVYIKCNIFIVLAKWENTSMLFHEARRETQADDFKHIWLRR